jgi:DNA-directed RNA polymerase subunit A'
MLLYVIRQNGMTMGLDEVFVSGEAYAKIQKILKDADDEADILINAFYENDTTVLRRAPGRSMRETLELRIRQVLAEARNTAMDTAAYYIGDEAHSVIMTKSGARGNILNLGQMSAVVGQQAIRGERINRGYSSRTLPHFKENDLTPRARGFVESSYRKGLNPEEFFFHAMGGREGLVDTAVRTSTSGYMQRRLVNALQDMIVENDGTVRNSDKNIIQFRYGDDGIDPMHTDHSDAVNLDVLLLKAKTLDLNEIREEMKIKPKPKTTPKKTTAKKPAAKKPAAKKTSPKETPKDEPKKIGKAKKKDQELSEEELREVYNAETSKNAEWRGKLTKGYLDWKKKRSK